MNLTTFLTRLYEELRYTTAPPSAVTTRLTAQINRVHRHILSLPGIKQLRDDVIPVTALANTARTGLPQAVARIKGITDRANNHKLTQVPLAALRIDDPAQAFTGGYPLRYAVIGNQAVRQQPTAATALYAVSDAAADTTGAVKIYVETIVTGGYSTPFISAGTSLTGTARVQIGTASNALYVEKIAISTVATGNISLYDAAAAGNELAQIRIGDTVSRYWGVEWFPIPTQDTTEYADITRRVFDLAIGTDEPLLPLDFHDMIIDGVLIREYRLLDDTRVAQARADFAEAKTALKVYVMDDEDRIASLRPTTPRWSQLGPMYPAGS